MKQIILIGFLTAFLTATTPLRAQTAPRDSDSRKGSRLELGRTVGSRKPTTPALTVKRFSLAPSTTAVNLDRAAAIRKNAPINEYYRSLLVARSATKLTTRSASPESAPATTAEARIGAEQELRADDRMYSNDRITVSNIYPNPASESAQIDYQITGQVNEAKLILLNILGSPVAEYDMQQNDRKVHVATRELATGYYFYQLSVDGKKVATKKLLVRHQ
ncbi:T9SS type A sorting domain-containing protein [Spirosoma endbachense]|uniref:T9SS type A sorting domain-containing protein n=1 Tax=Spirosoma endbachense TaxID=2666025 RepID=A0A6P1VPX1_9BACT|nr:T9SS type A sorting domain-containing protein [Spirosoma endbachense]QHV94664.1 T9SS type A sorting domain-containing protein [Spirosoma endbachense]